MARRILWLAVAALLVALAAPASGHASDPPYSNADYWAFADGIVLHLDSWWDADEQAYILRGSRRSASTARCCSRMRSPRVPGTPARRGTTPAPARWWIG